MYFRSLCHHHVAASGSQWKKDFNKHRTWVIAVLWALKDRRVEQSAEKKKQLWNSILLSFSYFALNIRAWIRWVNRVKLAAVVEECVTCQAACRTCFILREDWRSCGSSQAAAVTCSHTHSLAHKVLKHTTICWNFKQTKQLLNVMNLKMHSPTSWEFKHVTVQTFLSIFISLIYKTSNLKLFCRGVCVCACVCLGGAIQIKLSPRKQLSSHKQQYQICAGRNIFINWRIHMSAGVCQ